MMICSKDRPILITGGAGFIGTNLADRLLTQGQPVLIYDSLSRSGVERNLKWLQERHKDLVQVRLADIRDRNALYNAVRRSHQVFHFAAQVAVTTSLENPRHDFEANAEGTLNLLESLRALEFPPPLIFTSTNKVYGALEDLKLVKQGNRYEPEDNNVRKNGINECRPLDFQSPYGCSKGAADQYVVDYARSYFLPAALFRMSCIYGPHQFGTEDQGWVAHFINKAIADETITLYGDGMQVRDLLFIDDLVDALLIAQKNMSSIRGQAFNIGGGPANRISLRELVDLIGGLKGRRPEIKFGDWRKGDQRYYVSDSRKFQNATGWFPRVKIEDGVKRLYKWLLENSIEEPSMPAAGKRAGGQL